MFGFNKWARAAVIAVAVSSSASAQQPTTGGTTTGGTGGLTSGGQTGGLTLGGGQNALGNSGGFGGNGGGFGNSGSSGGGVGTPQTINPSGIAAPTGTYSSSLDPSNRFAGYYANPYFQGNSAPANGVANPGGFGSPLMSGGTGGRTTGGRTGAAGATRNTFGTQAGGIGGRGNQTAANQSGIVIPLQAQIAYTAQLRFPTRPPAPSKVQADVRSALDGTSMIVNSKLIQITADLDNNVTLSGTAADDDEIRLIEGMVRLTPGVGNIKNDLLPLKPSR